MAIEIKSNPANYSSAHGDLLFVVYEATKANDPVTYPDYKYVADIYIGTEFAARLRAFPRPDNKMGVFNIGANVREYLSSTLSAAASQLKCQVLGLGEFNIEVTVKFGEEYNYTTYTNLTVDSARVYYNHYNAKRDGANTVLDNYVNKAATIRPVPTPVYESAVFNLLPYFLSGTSIDLEIKSFLPNGTLQGTYTTTLSPLTTNTLQHFNFSPLVINLSSPGLIVSGLTGFYRVSFDSFSTYKQFNLVCEPRYEVFTMHFMNRFGGFESRNFTKVSRKTIEIDRKEYARSPYEIDMSGVVSYTNSNNAYHESRSVYGSLYREKMTLNTDLLTDAEYMWLGDLVVSPLAYIEILGYFYPVVITETNYEYRKQINDKLTNLTINIEFGDQLNTQLR
jgi:hypothetical protein